MAEDNNAGKISKFNAGQFQMERIHSLQRSMNVANINLLDKCPDTNIMNFD